MGQYFVCPSCKSVNGGCKALNCYERIQAMEANDWVRIQHRPLSELSPVPPLRYPQPWYSAMLQLFGVAVKQRRT